MYLPKSIRKNGLPLSVKKSLLTDAGRIEFRRRLIVKPATRMLLFYLSKADRIYINATSVPRDLAAIAPTSACRAHKRKVKALQEKINRGIAQLDRGEGIPRHAARTEMKRYSAEQRKRRR